MRSSSAVEQVTVNHLVAGSIPAFAAIKKRPLRTNRKKKPATALS